jgi:ADP-heptose:LPS heptosyltransferase
MTILITRHDKIGDFITALPMAKVLKEQKDVKIVFLVSPINYSIASQMPFIDDVILYEKDTKKLVNKLKLAKIDISISAYIDTHLGWSLFLANIPQRISPATKIAQIFFNKRIKQRRSEVKKYEWQYNLDLLLAFDSSLNLEFKKPLFDFKLPKKKFVIIHAGSGGSSDGNLSLDDYLRLENKITLKTDLEIVFTFGPDDKKAKDYLISQNSNLKIKDNFSDIFEFAKFISTTKLFISTSTGPMHLAGLSDTPTISFFGDNLFASPKRWSTISNQINQNNFTISKDYDDNLYKTIEERVLKIL